MQAEAGEWLPQSIVAQRVKIIACFGLVGNRRHLECLNLWGTRSRAVMGSGESWNLEEEATTCTKLSVCSKQNRREGCTTP